VDPCGEAGEFHTFVLDHELFASPISVLPGDVVESNGFLFQDLVLA